jgi:hypothetical protein
MAGLSPETIGDAHFLLERAHAIEPSIVEVDQSEVASQIKTPSSRLRRGIDWLRRLIRTRHSE